MMREKCWDLSAPVPKESILALPPLPIPTLLTHRGTSSGSYLHTLLQHVASRTPEPVALQTRTIRGADYTEYTLVRSVDGAPVFRAATCYGFRNLQNVVRKVGRAAGVQVGRGAAGRLARKAPRKGTEGERAYDYVEVMACPGGA